MKKNFYLSLRIAIALVLLIWLFNRIRFDKLKELNLCNTVVCIVAALFLMCCQVCFGAWRWKMLLQAQGIKISLFRAISLSFQGNAFSLFMPGGALGGDVVKAGIVAVEADEKKRMEGITTVALDRLIGMSALFLIVLIISVAGYRKIMQVDFTIRAGIISLLIACTVTILIVASLFFHDYFLKFRLYALFIDKMDVFFKGKIKRVISAIVLYRKKRGILLKAFLISLFLVHPFLLSTMYVLVWGISGSQPDFFSAYLAIALGNSAAVLPATPGGLGMRSVGSHIAAAETQIAVHDFCLAPDIVFKRFLRLGGKVCVTFIVSHIQTDAVIRRKSCRQTVIERTGCTGIQIVPTVIGNSVSAIDKVFVIIVFSATGKIKSQRCIRIKGQPSLIPLGLILISSFRRHDQTQKHKNEEYFFHIVPFS